MEASPTYLKTESLISYVADSLELSSFNKLAQPEKQYWPYVMARLEKYGNDDVEANRLVRLLKFNDPLHYSVPGTIRLIYRYHDCPAVRGNTQVLIKKAFERDDSYNVWTGEGNESQISMLRTSGYLFAQKAFLYGDYFENATGRLAEMKSWILDWSSRIYEVGTAEFNSTANEVNSLIGWLNLYDFAEDEEVRLAARAVLDYYAAEMALHHNSGYVGGAEMRGTLITNHEKTASYFLNWFWFKYADEISSFTGDNFMQLIYAATSEYRPPALLIEYAQSTSYEPEFYLNSKPSYLLDKQSFIKELYYRAPNYTLGSLYSNYGGWTQNCSRIVNWKLLVNSNDKFSEIRGNGVYWNNYSGLGRDPWTQWGQHENILIQLTKVPENAEIKYDEIDDLCKAWNNSWKKDFKKRFRTDNVKKNIYSTKKNHRFENESYISFPNNVEFSDTDGACFVNFGNVYMAILGVPAYQPTYLHSHNDKNILIVKNDPGKVCGFVIELFDAGNYPTYDDFKDDFIRQHIMYLDTEVDLLTYESPNDKHVEMLFMDDGLFQEPIIDWGFGLNEPRVNQHLSDFKQPDWSGASNSGRTPLLLAENFNYQFEEVWPVFSGPSINLDKSILKVDFDGKTYLVDYSQRIPVFSE